MARHYPHLLDSKLSKCLILLRGRPVLYLHGCFIRYNLYSSSSSSLKYSRLSVYQLDEQPGRPESISLGSFSVRLASSKLKCESLAIGVGLTRLGRTDSNLRDKHCYLVYFKSVFAENEAVVHTIDLPQ